LSILAIPTSALIRRFGARKVLIAGGLVTGLGQILASFALSSILGLFITFGAIRGAGFSMIYMVGSSQLKGSLP
jgi:Na+/melibiose symporter-like transporter